MSNEIEAFRAEFNTAFKLATARALLFEGSERYMDELFGLILKANFYVWADETCVADYFELLEAKSRDGMSAVLDFLHEFNSLFYGFMLLRGVQSVEVDSKLADAFGINRYQPSHTPQAYHQAYQRNPTPATIDEYIAGNPWLKAIMWIRLLGLKELLTMSGKQDIGKKAAEKKASD